MGQQFVDDLVHWPAGFDHDEMARGLASAAANSASSWRRRSALRAMIGDEFVGAGAVTIEQRDTEALARRVASEIAAHHRETENADIGKLGHRIDHILKSRAANAATLPFCSNGRSRICAFNYAVLAI